MSAETSGWLRMLCQYALAKFCMLVLWAGTIGGFVWFLTR
jgi:hypothetical protein